MSSKSFKHVVDTDRLRSLYADRHFGIFGSLIGISKMILLTEGHHVTESGCSKTVTASSVSHEAGNEVQPLCFPGCSLKVGMPSA